MSIMKVKGCVIGKDLWWEKLNEADGKACLALEGIDYGRSKEYANAVETLSAISQTPRGLLVKKIWTSELDEHFWHKEYMRIWVNRDDIETT